ncbi:MAG: apolipoprotein N-acyltransferase [Bacteroidales bacterium]|jgi:apolipoprotein N-acyltransferase
MNTIIKKRYLLLLSLLSGLLLSFGWPARGFPILLFFGFIPLLFIEDYIYQNKKLFSRLSFFCYTYISMLLWNILTTYWIYYSTTVGAILAITLNALFMSLALSLFHYSRTVLRHNYAYVTYILFWITYEYMHLNWDLSWSWMNLGNGFANHPAWIQWYEYTGCFGGTLWILLLNYMIFRAIKMFFVFEKTSKNRFIFSLFCFGFILIPIIISLFIYYNYHEKGETTANVIIVQPNIDPYNEKFGGLTPEQQSAKLLKLAKLKTTQETDLLVGPETAISEVCEDQLDKSNSIDSLKCFVKKYPHLNILLGLSSYKIFRTGEIISPTARPYTENEWCDEYDSAILLNSSDNKQLYHKSKLVPGVEKMPWSEHLKFLEKYAIDLGGTVGSLGIQKERSVFYSQDKKIKAAPVVCYESIYGEYVTGYVKNGANVICVITNDGWWRNTAGYKQHFCYASLRAIETRRSIVQSANTGISGFINQRGDVQQKTGWWEGDVLQQNVTLNEEKTFYVKHGDYIARFSEYLSIMALLFSFCLTLIRKLKKIIPKQNSLL